MANPETPGGLPLVDPDQSQREGAERINDALRLIETRTDEGLRMARKRSRLHDLLGINDRKERD